MNLIDALKTGRPIRRKGSIEYTEVLEYGQDYARFTMEDILADDWEVESISVTISREHFEKAWRIVCSVSKFVKELDSKKYNEFTVVRDILIKELGL